MFNILTIFNVLLLIFVSIRQYDCFKKNRKLKKQIFPCDKDCPSYIPNKQKEIQYYDNLINSLWGFMPLVIIIWITQVIQNVIFPTGYIGVISTILALITGFIPPLFIMDYINHLREKCQNEIDDINLESQMQLFENMRQRRIKQKEEKKIIEKKKIYPQSLNRFNHLEL